MSQSLSIRFQSPERITGPARDVLALLREPLALPPLPASEDLGARTVRQRLRSLEKERALKMVDGTATWIITDRMSVNPDLGERIDNCIVGAGLGKGRIVYGPPDLCLPSGLYMAIIEFQITNMLDNRWARVTGEVILNNQQYLSQQTKTISAEGSYAFRLPFRVRENDLLRHARPAIEVRLKLRSVLGVKVTQVAVVFKTMGVRNLVAHPGAHLHSTGNAWLRWLGRKVGTLRA